jgi:phosphonatase-like hydrolase
MKLIVFDLAGTTVHDNRDVHKVLQKSMASFGISITLDEANDVMGIPKPIAIRSLLSKHNSVVVHTDELIATIHQHFVENMISFYRSDPAVHEKEGVTDTFVKLKENGMKIAIDTGFDRAIAEAVLDRMKWRENDLIDVSVTSDEVPKGRPFPDMIYKAMALVKVSEARDVAKVGDTLSDLEEGTSAGCGYVIGITSGAFSSDVLKKGPHTHLINSVPEVLKVLELD